MKKLILTACLLLTVTSSFASVTAKGELGATDCSAMDQSSLNSNADVAVQGEAPVEVEDAAVVQ